jgi:D-alanyl-lipoteichoic acid acyltransferase DltB (MBOAT superfamily)
MTIVTILILAGAPLLTRLIFRTKGRGWVLLISSILAIYWLQPSMPIRNLAFWLSTATLILTLFTWEITSAQEERASKRNVITLAVIAGLVLMVGLTRYLSLKGILTPSQPPPTWQVLVSIALLAGLFGALLTAKKTIPALLWIGLACILGLFIVLKLPWLTGITSSGLHLLMGQSAEHTSALDIRWLGFSYVAFRLIHTIRDRQSGRLPQVTLQEYFIYVIFFPSFTAGPIDRIERFISDLRQPVAITAEDFGEGGKRLAIGLFKKFAIADSLALIALNGSNASQVQSTGWTWLLLYAFTFQIYFDFSGYTDIAIGLARWLGFRLPENFNHPYLKPNLTQFWNNWHMTLTQWFRAYFFNPLTRSLRSAKKPLSPSFIILITQASTMVLIGLWHGITWNFAIWGLWHGLGLFVQNRWSALIQPHTAWLDQRPIPKGIVTVVGTLLTFNFVALGWVWFAMPTLQSALIVFGKLLGG